MNYMEKFDSIKHVSYINHLPFSYFSTLCYLDCNAYTFERNGEHLIVWQDIIYPHDFPSIFLPYNKLNWEKASMALITPEEIELIKKEKIEIKLTLAVGQEYFYKTKDLIEPKSKVKQRVNQFMKSYQFEVANNYPREKIIEFYNFWKKQRIHKSITFPEDESSFLFYLDALNGYNVQQVYVIVDKKLTGFAWGIKHQSGDWVGLHLKTNYEYKGLSRFLHRERAKLFADCDMFTLGTGAHDPGIAQFKEELGPVFKKDYYYVLTGKKQR